MESDTNMPDVTEIEQDAQLDPATLLGNRTSELSTADPLADLEALTTSYIELIAPENEEEGAQLNQAYAGEEEQANEYARNSTGFVESSAYQSPAPEAVPTAAPTSWDNPPAPAPAPAPAVAAVSSRNGCAAASSWDDPPAPQQKPQERPNLPESNPVGQAVMPTEQTSCCSTHQSSPKLIHNHL